MSIEDDNPLAALGRVAEAVEHAEKVRVLARGGGVLKIALPLHHARRVRPLMLRRRGAHVRLAGEERRSSGGVEGPEEGGGIYARDEGRVVRAHL